MLTPIKQMYGQRKKLGEYNTTIRQQGQVAKKQKPCYLIKRITNRPDNSARR